MAYQAPTTIKATLDQISRHDIVLPAIQREFVWQPAQICRLFDSLMQGYPFGTFLYWKVQPENSGKYKFYDFVLRYHERDNPHCPALPELHNQSLTAVLDGQQRLTALNIGLHGSMAWKLPRMRRSNPNAFPIRHLYLDLLWMPDDEAEDGAMYHFRFLTNEQIRAASESDDVCWFKVGDILSLADPGPAMTAWLNDRLTQDKVTQAHRVLFELYQVVHNKLLVSFYEESSQELEKVLQIFIRTNNGATILSYSDLLLSVAVAQWSTHDAREEIHQLVDELNRIGAGFSFSKDFVLKAGLMLSDIGSVGFKVENFDQKNMAIFEDKWDDINRALLLTVQLVAGFGFNGQNLRAQNAILPIAYYLYMKNPGDPYLTHISYQQDRRTIREWLIRSLLKSGVWGSGLDTLLTALREAIRQSGTGDFPAARIREEMAKRGRLLIFENEELEQLADMQYGDHLTFIFLSLLFPFIDLHNKYDLDHVFSRARFTARGLRGAGVPEGKIKDFIDRRDGLPNLQILAHNLHLGKGATLPAEWLRAAFDTPEKRLEHQNLHLLGDVPESIADFDAFYDARRELLKERIKGLLGRQSAIARQEETMTIPMEEDEE